MKQTDPERLSDILRRLWALCSVACAIGATGYVLLGDATGALAFAFSGVAFWCLSNFQEDG